MFAVDFSLALCFTVNALFFTLEFIRYLAIALLLVLALMGNNKEMSPGDLEAIPGGLRYFFYFCIGALLMIVVFGMLEGILDLPVTRFRELAFDTAVAGGFWVISLEWLGRFFSQRKGCQVQEP